MHKDFRGKDINVGDSVIITNHTYSQTSIFLQGVVRGFTEKFVNVEVDEGVSFGTVIYKRRPDKVAVIKE